MINWREIIKKNFFKPSSFLIIGAGLGLLFAGPRAEAFTSRGTQSLQAGITVGGSIFNPPLIIDHVPIAGYSSVTHEIIIQGSAGQNPSGVTSLFSVAPQKITVKSKVADVNVGMIQMTLEYRFIVNETTPTVFNFIHDAPQADDTFFSFLIPSTNVVLGVLEYRIRADRLRADNSISTTTYSPVTGYYHAGDSVAHAPENFTSLGGQIVVVQGNPNVGNPSVVIPAGVLNTNASVSFGQLAVNDPAIPQGLTNPVSVFGLEMSPKTQSPIQLSLSYPDFDYQKGGQQGLLGNNPNWPESNSIVMGWDGIGWVKLGGQVQATQNLIRVTALPYQFYAIVPGVMTADATRDVHTKIVTANHCMLFTTLAPDIKVEIFDISMHRIKTLYGGTTWCGYDDDGHFVESGAYIFQYKYNGELVSGVVGVAK